MRITRLLAPLVTLVVCTGAAQAQQAAPRDTSTAWGRKYTAWFYAGHADSLWTLMSDQMKSNIGSAERLEGFAKALQGQTGGEAKVLSEQVLTRDGYLVYLREVTMVNGPEPAVVQWAVGPDGKIAGFFVQPKSALQKMAQPNQ